MQVTRAAQNLTFLLSTLELSYYATEYLLFVGPLQSPSLQLLEQRRHMIILSWAAGLEVDHLLAT